MLEKDTGHLLIAHVTEEHIVNIVAIILCKAFYALSIGGSNVKPLIFQKEKQACNFDFDFNLDFKSYCNSNLNFTIVIVIVRPRPTKIHLSEKLNSSSDQK